MCLGIFSTSFGVLFKWMTSFVTLEICIVTLATSVSWKVCSAMRRINKQEAGRTAYMMNEKNKPLGKPGVKTEGTKKNLSHRGEVGKWAWFHFLLSWQVSGSACKGLEWKYAWKMQKAMKKHKLLVSNIQFFYGIILSFLTPCYFPVISQTFRWVKCNPHTTLPGFVAAIIFLAQKPLPPHELFGYRKWFSATENFSGHPQSLSLSFCRLLAQLADIDEH